MRIPFNLPLNSTIMLVAGGIFVLVLFVVVASMGRKSLSGAPGSQSVDDRLTQYAGRTDRNKAEEIKPLAQLDAAVSKGKQGSKIARDLARADLKLTVTEFIGLKILAAVAAAAAGAFIGRASAASMVLSAIVAGVLLSFAPNLYVGFAAKKRVLQSMDLVSREAPMPLSNEFRRVVQEIGLGLSSDEALANLMRRMPSEDLDLLITAVNIQHEVGGNLAQILETIGHTIRERVRIKGEIQVLTAQGRISAYVITGLPIVLTIMITLINPDYMAPMFQFGLPPKAWCCLPVTALTMIITGFFVIMKIVDIEV
jgi:tight adherence protein B